MSVEMIAPPLLSPRVRFGTSSWTYPGWRGTVYRDEYKNERDFKARSLEEYGRYPLFRTVGIDSSFYSAPSAATLARYAAQLPPNFQWVSKVWERLTIPRYPGHARYGKDAGTWNPDFLNVELFASKVLKPYEDESLAAHAGPFVFQFPFIAKSVMHAQRFRELLTPFLAKLPPKFRYAIEIRNPEYLGDEYFSLLNAHGATHCFNHLNFMPSLREQMKGAAAAGGLSAPFFVARILTPRGVSYEKAVELFKPYDSLKQPNFEMRADVARLVGRALERDADAFIVVNNRAEGNAPGTISEIIKIISARSSALAS